MDIKNIVMGTCQGTGAAIYVCLGFQPVYVKLWNMEDAGSLFAEIEWWRDMAKVTAFAQGIKTLTGTTYRQISGLTTTGIAVYAGGEKLIYDGHTSNRWEKLSDGSDVTEVFIDGHYKAATSLSPAYKSIGDSIIGHTATAKDDLTTVTAPAGFIIAVDTDMNVNDEVMIWMAMG